MTNEMQVLCDLPRNKRFGRRQLVLINIGCVEPWVKNPGIRTENVVELGKRLAGDIGQLVPASVVPAGKVDSQYRYRIVDGHRRFAVLSLAGVQTFIAILYLDVRAGSNDFGALFEILNSGTRAVNMRERVWLALNDEQIAAGKEATALAEEIKKNLTKEALDEFLEAFCPIAAFKVAKSAFSEMTELQLEPGDRGNRRAVLSKLVMWQLKHNEQQSLKLFVTETRKIPVIRTKKQKLNVLLGCLYGDQPFPAGTVEAELDEEEDEDEAANG